MARRTRKFNEHENKPSLTKNFIISIL